MVDGDALEMRFGETQRGFESPPLRICRVGIAHKNHDMVDIAQGHLL